MRTNKHLQSAVDRAQQLVSAYLALAVVSVPLLGMFGMRWDVAAVTGGGFTLLGWIAWLDVRRFKKLLPSRTSIDYEKQAAEAYTKLTVAITSLAKVRQELSYLYSRTSNSRPNTAVHGRKLSELLSEVARAEDLVRLALVELEENDGRKIQ